MTLFGVQANNPAGRFAEDAMKIENENPVP